MLVDVPARSTGSLVRSRYRGGSVNSLSALVSPYVGIARSLDEVLAGTADPPLPTFSCETVDDERLLGSPLTPIGGVCGIGLHRDAAIGAALGETAERYSLCHIEPERLIRKRARELAAAVTPSRFGLFASDQYARPSFPFVPFDEAVEVPWVDAWDLHSGELAWLPAELVFLADPIEEGELRTSYSTSSGAACAPSLDAAVLKGLLELLERDAFMIAWASRLSLPLLDWREHAGLAAIDRRYFAVTGLDYAAVDLSIFHGVPSVLAVVRAPRGESAAVGVGAGTAATIEEAWWKALSEAFACRAAAARLARLGRGNHLEADASNVSSFLDHILFYADHERAERTRFLDASTQRVDVHDVPPLPGTPSEGIEAVLSCIAAAGSSAYAVEATAPDIASLGVRVVKTVAPELCMLDVVHSARFLGNPRLRTVPAQLGLRPAELAFGDLNPDPHPFP
jgi:ribosomal protein S12 methylthiotransferase accessory factor